MKDISGKTSDKRETKRVVAKHYNNINLSEKASDGQRQFEPKGINFFWYQQS